METTFKQLPKGAKFTLPEFPAFGVCTKKTYCLYETSAYDNGSGEVTTHVYRIGKTKTQVNEVKP